ncbi:MAG: hypothetical protein PUK02_06415 [Parabacteroides sp.]|jgi:hypothetical protein|uniref:Methyltransferase FkbM domain-containing protein n=1 Tax=Parabacteroides faecalis TaxID=2924040 RepID=A0ABT0BWV0_9BACT|nr:hypothetical protein [Parabacteroides faecalis]MBS7342357.1 hypothetical protein [Parabacteroides sp.]MDY5623952.1 hypothetical protein [Bacteroidales bacterium]CDE64976.1 putative uncharacterized protein [Parabacteroides sp. CAG:409]HIX22537.1 hypothetical protein [Candidatus Parabacteroides faecavium]MCI7286798.1 hypothetical protein [Parabacteroides sp.]
MHENDYTFVTIDNEEDAPLLSDAVVVDVDGNDGILDAVMLDDVPVDGTDFITLSDDSVVMPDSDDVSDFISIDVDGSDISFIL